MRTATRAPVRRPARPGTVGRCRAGLALPLSGVALALALAFTPALNTRAATTNAPSTNGTPTPGPAGTGRHLGIEGHVSINLGRPDYQTRPLDDRTPLILRIERVAPAPNGQHRYELFYIGLEAGPYRLADYLVHPDGSRPDELRDLQIYVRAMLPDDHNGHLNPHVARVLPRIGGYRTALVTLGVAWVGGLVAFALASRRRRAPVPADARTPAPSYADRLRPLVEAAAAGTLSVSQQADLERLFMGYWRERLQLPDLRMAEAVQRLKADAEAGELLRALERWLHRPGGVNPAEVSVLLEPYRRLPAPAQPLPGGAA